ncbi:unnamed protein product [Phytomonas sp. EM1]|nr:unnamed protein product [Phytomonas sp. EM1]|eukprot:CCW61733.1 unnamed protein product [Phytomonas sp. isolate EM1]
MDDPSKIAFTLQDIRERLAKNKKHCVVIIHGLVCDLTNYVNEHPGGVDVLYRNNGKDVTSVFDALHSRSTRRSVQKWAIGHLVEPSLESDSTCSGLSTQQK